MKKYCVERRTDDGQLVLTVEQNVLAAAFDWVDELKRQPAATDNSDVSQVSEPVALGLEMPFMYTRHRRTNSISIIGRHLIATTQIQQYYSVEHILVTKYTSSSSSSFIVFCHLEQSGKRIFMRVAEFG